MDEPYQVDIKDTERARITISIGEKYVVLAVQGTMTGEDDIEGLELFRVEDGKAEWDEDDQWLEAAELHAHIYDYLNYLTNPPPKGWRSKPKAKKKKT